MATINHTYYHLALDAKKVYFSHKGFVYCTQQRELTAYAWRLSGCSSWGITFHVLSDLQSSLYVHLYTCDRCFRDECVCVCGVCVCVWNPIGCVWLNDSEATTVAVVVTIAVAAILPEDTHYGLITHYVGGNRRAWSAAMATSWQIYCFSIDLMIDNLCLW